MLTKTCCDCGESFDVEPSKAWATRCLPCWIAQQDRQGKRKVEELHAHVEYWRHRAQSSAEAQALQQTVERLTDENSLLRLELMAARAQVSAGKTLPPDWRDQLPRLIQLCHPDRHSGSVAANRATVWLLELKQRSC